MKTLFAIILLFSFSHSICVGAEPPVYVLSSDCVTSIKIRYLKIHSTWAVVISLNDAAANALREYSKKNIGKSIRVVDGRGIRITKNDMVIYDVISSNFLISGMGSRKNASKAKKSISSSKGACGIK